jgi:hypothetical protein
VSLLGEQIAHTWPAHAAHLADHNSVVRLWYGRAACSNCAAKGCLDGRGQSRSRAEAIGMGDDKAQTRNPAAAAGDELALPATATTFRHDAALPVTLPSCALVDSVAPLAGHYLTTSLQQGRCGRRRSRSDGELLVAGSRALSRDITVTPRLQQRALSQSMSAESGAPLW